MAHNSRCANANPDSKCRCSCGGKLHGINFHKPETLVTVDKYIDMDNTKKFIKSK